MVCRFCSEIARIDIARSRAYCFTVALIYQGNFPGRGSDAEDAEDADNRVTKRGIVLCLFVGGVRGGGGRESLRRGGLV